MDVRDAWEINRAHCTWISKRVRYTYRHGGNSFFLCVSYSKHLFSVRACAVN